MRIVLLCALAVGALFVSGCAGTAYTSQTPTTLNQVNAQLAGQTARVEFTSEQMPAVQARGVMIGVESTSYMDPARGERVSVPTSEVARVVVRERTEGYGTRGALVGAVPGLTFLAIGVIAYASDGGDYSGLSLLVGTVIGVPVALAGAAIGAVVGNALEGEREREVYRGPVERYAR